MSDEFESSESLLDWSRIFEVEGWGADQMDRYDINESRSGFLTLVPKASSWYEDWRGILLFKLIEGDFVATMYVEPRNRDLSGAPSSSYSLAGIMARTPRDDIRESSDWTQNGENYIFLSTGTADQPGSYQFEVKTTVNSNSSLQIDSGTPSAIIQVARIGDVFLVLRKQEGQDWQVHRRYQRTDMPDTIQVGITVYTDWGAVSSMDPFVHNQSVVEGGDPDLYAEIDFFRFQRPEVPHGLEGLSFSDSSEVSDLQIIGFLADNANRASTDLVQPLELVQIANTRYSEGGVLELGIESESGKAYQAQKSTDLTNWETVAELEASSSETQFLINNAFDPVASFFRVKSE